MARAHPRLSRQETVVALGVDRRIVLGEEIGSGTAASVYRAALEGPFGLARPVAFKVLDALTSDEHETVVRTLANAARALAHVRHPNVVALHEFGVLAGGRPYLVEELVEGPSLDALGRGYEARRMRMPLDLALFVGVEVAEALAGARSSLAAGGVRLGLVHGDLSSREVLLSAHGEVKVADFGIALATGAASSVRSFPDLAKRAAFHAPEVIGGEAPTPRADVFSIGVMLWQMLVGPRFPPGTDDAERLTMARAGLVHTTVFDPHLPAPVKQLLRRALDPDPERRFPHAGIVAFELRRAAFSLGVGDGRVFLRHAIQRLDEDAEEAIANERLQVVSVATPPPADPPAPVAVSTPVPIAPTSGTVRCGAPRPGGDG